jgi:hypothetical protein
VPARHGTSTKRHGTTPTLALRGTSASRAVPHRSSCRGRGTSTTLRARYSVVSCRAQRHEGTKRHYRAKQKIDRIKMQKIKEDIPRITKILSHKSNRLYRSIKNFIFHAKSTKSSASKSTKSIIQKTATADGAARHHGHVDPRRWWPAQDLARRRLPSAAPAAGHLQGPWRRGGRGATMAEARGEEGARQQSESGAASVVEQGRAASAVVRRRLGGEK